MKKINIFATIGVSAVIVGAGVIRILGDNQRIKYSDTWFNTVSNEVLDADREKIRQLFCAAGKDYSLSVSLQNLLYKFDDVKRTRAGICGKEYIYPKHREHGWHLTK